MTKSDPRPRLPRARAVELEMMSTSTSSLPLPETSLTLHHCHALSRDSVQFATLSRGRSRRRNDESDASVRLSRSFSSFHPVVPSVPTIKANDRLVWFMIQWQFKEKQVKKLYQLSCVCVLLNLLFYAPITGISRLPCHPHRICGNCEACKAMCQTIFFLQIS